MRACSLWLDRKEQKIPGRWLMRFIKKQWKNAVNYVIMGFEKRQQMSREKGASVSASNLIQVYWRLSCLTV